MKRSLIALLAVLFLAACSSDDADQLAFQDVPADQLYNEALVLMNDGSYREAIVKLRELDRLHPYTEYARRAMVMLAFSNYSTGRYDEAINSARRYLALYPGHKDAAYAQYIIGNSYFRQIPDVTRDQEMTQKALAAMDELVRNYPDSEYATDARRKIQVTRDQLAGKEMDVGRYYLQRDDYLAAINRFRTVVEQYQDTRHIEEALFRLTEAYYALGIVPEAQTAAAVLGHNFPDSQWYKDAYSLLKEGGYEPSENRKSWISRAFDGINVL
ncbi:outer membrane protein assembly factor BamD [Amorphus orientalis]|uniref:Outer membrane protein assembly factor BamD n=1 Tax=Amorphus orientalis TaxID=649198 RepID=A0AAE3VPD5_9HYPH|nr:outer membrane protein assembly factor BamD [Amorphus orientalis]MDQ0315325.1 outer membrane protein assembly factor BamD [Amorphus orientalis]